MINNQLIYQDYWRQLASTGNSLYQDYNFNNCPRFAISNALYLREVTQDPRNAIEFPMARGGISCPITRGTFCACREIPSWGTCTKMLEEAKKIPKFSSSNL